MHATWTKMVYISLVLRRYFFPKWLSCEGPGVRGLSVWLSSTGEGFKSFKLPKDAGEVSVTLSAYKGYIFLGGGEAAGHHSITAIELRVVMPLS